jgi:Alpha/beta hydrolase domain containing 18
MIPYYGARKPTAQHRWFLRSVHDSVVQSNAIAVEIACVLHWARISFTGPLGEPFLAVTGISYGAAMAAHSSRLYPGALAIVPFMATSGPGDPFANRALLACRYEHHCVIASVPLRVSLDVRIRPQLPPPSPKLLRTDQRL